MWNAISDVGDAALTIPVAITCAVWIVLSDRVLAVRWILLLVTGIVPVGVTKILYAGCGIEISSIGLRVISGHTTLSTVVWTVTMILLCRGAERSLFAGAVAGLLVGVLSATAHIFDRSDSSGHRSPLLHHPVNTIAYGHHAPFQAVIEEYCPPVYG